VLYLVSLALISDDCLDSTLEDKNENRHSLFVSAGFVTAIFAFWDYFYVLLIFTDVLSLLAHANAIYFLSHMMLNY